MHAMNKQMKLMGVRKGKANQRVICTRRILINWVIVTDRTIYIRRV